MVSAFGQAARDALEEALRGALAEEIGELAGSARAAIRDEAIGGVVVPLAKALLGGREEGRTLPSELRS